MNPSVNPGHTLEGLLASRITPADIARAGLSRPAFFISANHADAAFGRVVDSVSGAVATHIGSVGFSRLGEGIDAPQRGCSRLPCISLPAGAGLSFTLPSLFTSDAPIIISALVRTANLYATTHTGEPVIRRRSLAGRGYIDLGGTTTACSGWTSYISQTKALTGTAAYGYASMGVRGALSSSLVESTDASSYPEVWGADYIGDPSSLKSIAILLYKTPASANSAMVYEASRSHGNGSQTSASRAGSSVCLLDYPSRAFLVGCSRDSATDTFYTDFLEGDIVMLGVWSGVSSIAGNASANLRQFLPQNLLRSVGESGRRIPMVPPKTSETFYVSSKVHDALRPARVGEFVQVGDVVTIEGRVYRAKTAGVLSSLRSNFRFRGRTTMDNFPTDFRAVRGSVSSGPIGRVVLEEITGDSTGTPGRRLDSIIGATDGDVVSVMPSHDFVAHPIDTLRSGPVMQQSRGWGASAVHGTRRGLPVLLDIAPAARRARANITLTMYGFWSMADTTTRYSSLTLLGAKGAAILRRVYNSGGYFAMSFGGPAALHQCAVKPSTWWFLDTTDITYPTPATDTPLSRVTSGMVDGLGGLSLKMYGGLISGRRAEVSNYWGGQAFYGYGVQSKHRFRMNILTGTYSLYAYNYVVSAAYSRHFLHGGVSGVPFVHDLNSSRRNAGVHSAFDSLRAETPRIPSPSPSGAYTSLVYRNASTALIGPTRYAVAAPSFPSMQLPKKLTKWVTVVSGGHVRLYLSGSVPIPFTGIIEVSYLDTVSGMRKAVSTFTEAPTMQSISVATWFPGTAAAAYTCDIPTPGIGSGRVVVTIVRLDSATNFDPDFSIV